MNLVPVSREEVETGIVRIDPVRRQKIGIRSGRVRRRPLIRRLRLPGIVVHDERLITDVTVRVDGWIEKIRVDETWVVVTEGQTLVEIYSPDLVQAQEELLSLIRLGRRMEISNPLADPRTIQHSARRKLELLGIDASTIDRVTRSGQVARTLPLLSPAPGHVMSRSVVAGSHVKSGQVLYRLADLSHVWVHVDVDEGDLSRVRVGDAVRLEFPDLAGESLPATVSFIHPHLDPRSRTGRIRVELENPGHRLRPEMLVDVHLEQDLGKPLTVPDSAVIVTGPRHIVFRDLGDGRLQPTDVGIGTHSGEVIEIRQGLEEGDRIVISGNFLVAAESRIRAASTYWGGEHRED